MAYSLLMTPKQACEKHWEAFQDDCSGFAKAAALELCVLLPSVNLFDGQERRNADIITLWIKSWLPSPNSPFLAIPPGEGAAVAAMTYADRGDFVLAGATHEEINRHRRADRHTTHGHLAVVTSGTGQNGWPRGYWGSYGSSGARDQSLSATFNRALKNELHYFAVMRGTVETGFK